MHSSRLAGFIIDCRTSDLDGAAEFWSSALGLSKLDKDNPLYQRLDASERDLAIEVQEVTHDSRVHLDIETDDIDAEATRLERLGAKRVEKKPRWWVMEAPTGQRFCVIRASADLASKPGARRWP